jgi:acyl carrier protein
LTYEDFVVEWVTERTGSQIGKHDDIFVVGGIDSLDFVELLEDAERVLKLRIDPMAVEDWSVARTAHGMGLLAAQID